jgi:hypothetical protein
MNQAALLNHEFRIAAYAITWVVQLGYVLLLTLKWRAQKRAADRVNQPHR